MSNATTEQPKIKSMADLLKAVEVLKATAPILCGATFYVDRDILRGLIQNLNKHQLTVECSTLSGGRATLTVGWLT